MFFFSIGTVPLMFAFGAASTLLSRKFTSRMMKVSAALVMILGVIMLNRGFSLSGLDPMGNLMSALHNPANSRVQQLSDDGSADGAIEIQDDVQYVSSTFTGRRYAPITVQAGVPVVWTIDVQAINGCNNPMQIREFDMVVDLSVGENIVEFTPTKVGTIPYSCWMGMISSRITVVDDLSEIPAGDEQLDEAEVDEFAFLDDFFANFYGTPFEVSDITAATISGDIQVAAVTVQNGAFFPSVIVLQEGIDFVVRFNVLDGLDNLNEEYLVIFPEYGGMIDLATERETPVLPAVMDFGFGDVLGNKVFVMIVTDIDDFVVDDVSQAAAEYFGGSE
jgi:hypothetical protein